MKSLKAKHPSSVIFMMIIAFMMASFTDVFAQGFCEDFELINSFPSTDWNYHTLYNPGLVPGINTVNGNPGHCYVPGGITNGANTEIYHNSYLADYSNGLIMSCDFFVSDASTHYTDLAIGLPRIPIENGVNLSYSVMMHFNSGAGSRNVQCILDSDDPDHAEMFSLQGGFKEGVWHKVKIVIHENQKVSFYLDSNLVYCSTKTIDPRFNMQPPVLHGFNKRPVYADNFCVSEILDDKLAIGLDMPASHYYADDIFHLNCRLLPYSESAFPGRLFVMLDINGAMYFYPTWNQFTWFDLFEEDKDEWSASLIVLDDTTEIILEAFKMPFFPFPMHGCLFMATFTDEDVTQLLGNIDIVEWGFGGEQP